VPVTNWNTTQINGVDYLVIDAASFRIPLDWDPSSNMFIAVAAPNGAVGNFPALVQGDPGVTPTIDTVIDFTALEYNDPTADSASWIQESTNTYQLVLNLHKGAPGAAGGTTLMSASDLVATGAVAGQMMIVNPSVNGFVLHNQLVGDRFVPATILSASSGNPAFTLATVTIAAQLFDWRPHVEGYCIFTGTGSDLQVDLVARLGVETSGSDVGRGTQPAGQYPAAHVLTAGPPPGVADSYDRVAAGVGPTTIYLRGERQSGGSTFTTSAATTRFSVEVRPVPGS
jgi:hypothetical protein